LATGLIALLDDIAAIAKLAAASLDDVAAQTAKASVKAAGVVIDDTAVTPTYVVGLAPARELPIIWRIAVGSLRNKLVFLLPICLLLGYFAPWLITPLLMIGGIYLCFEGAEKIYEAFSGHHPEEAAGVATLDPASLEQQKVSGAIRTDFILSAEIMALTLAGVSTSNIATQAAVLAAVGILITIAVYGVVAFIVKADDIGLRLVRTGGRIGRAIGQALVKGVPIFLKGLALVGTAAMLWVGGSIVIHGLAELGIVWPEHIVEQASHVAEAVTTGLAGTVRWLFATAVQAIFGLVLGGVAVLVVCWVKPLYQGQKAHT
jgi:predicted DNA repair protein MutK